MEFKNTELKCFRYNTLEHLVWFRSDSTKISENLNLPSEHEFSSDWTFFHILCPRSSNFLWSYL